ncbi:MAG: UDP-N-acetylmuramoyl-L-alanine--D-glutamate ligase [Candidatus Saccharimonadales bacterium]
MNVAILGYDVEGKASYEFFAGHGDKLTVCDQNPAISLPDGADSQLGDNYLDNLDRFDLLVRTPGLHPTKILEKNPGVGDKITTQTNEFLKASPTKNIIGVTGTKGKGTTSTLIDMILEADGRQVFLGGNIGVPPLTFLPQLTKDSWVVLELSSFQLIDLKQSPHIALCLMVVPEHLNVHADMDEYVSAKSQLFAHQTTEDIAIYFDDNETSKQIARAGDGQKLAYYTEPGAVVQGGSIVIDRQVVCKTDDLKLLGEHNWQNACAAVTTAWQVTKNIEAMRSVLTTFSGLEHRLEFVREFDGVKYYDDSFGTTPETAIVAIKAFTEPKVVILGGSDKGVTFEPLAQTVADCDVRQAIIIGDTGPQIIKALQDVGFSNIVLGGNTMAEMIAACREAAQPGDIVLLSTGCASFGLFENYKDRGNQFKQAVRDLV